MYLVYLLFILLISTTHAQLYTVKQLKEILLSANENLVTSYAKPALNSRICNCKETLDVIADMKDSKIINVPMILVYPLPVIDNCKDNVVYPVRRVLLNQTQMNYGMCKNGYFSLDMQDADPLFVPPSKDPQIPPSPPNPPKTPIPKIPTNETICPQNCIDLIQKIPKGPSGPPGPPGPPGNPNSPDGNKGLIGNAPPRAKQNVTRTFMDIVKAYNQYTGCSIETGEGYLWNINNIRQTDCKVRGEYHTPLKDLNPGNEVKTGYIILWFWNNHENWYLPAMAYRAVENDIVPVLCGHDPSPIFLNHMKPIPSDVQCSLARPTLSLISYFIYYLIFAIVVVISIYLYSFRFKIVQLVDSIRVVWEFCLQLVRNHDLAQEQPEPIIDGNFEDLLQQ